MRRAAHWAWKDARRLALWLAVWAAVLALRVGNTVAPASWLRDATIDGFGPVATGILFVLIAVVAVHEDPPTDPRAFWPTRAVSSRQVLAAKWLLVGLGLIVPATVVDVTEIAATGAAPQIVARAVPEVLLEWAAWGAVAIALAAATTSLSGVFGTAVAIALLVVATRIALELFLGADAFIRPILVWTQSLIDPAFMEQVEGVYGSRALVTAAVVALLATFVAAWTFARRLDRVARIVVALGIVGLTVLWSYWRWDLFQRPAEAGLRNAGATEPLELALEPIGRPTAEPPLDVAAANRRMTIVGRFRATDVEAPRTAEVVGMSGTLRYPDGSSYILHSRQPMEDWIRSYWNVAPVVRLLGDVRLLNDDVERAEGEYPVVEMTVEQYAAHRMKHARLEGTATVALRRYEIAGVRPLRPGARFQSPGEDFVVTDVQLQHGSCGVQARGSAVSLWTAPSESHVERMLFFRFDRSVIYVLRNARRREALVAESRVLTGFGWLARSRLDKMVWMLSFDGSRIDEDWLRDADLVRIEVATDAEVTRPIELAAFAIDPAAGPPPPPPPPSRLPPLPEGAPRASDAVRPELNDDPTLAAATLADDALMALDWYGPTTRAAGMEVVTRRDPPGPGIELDVRVEARPSRDATGTKDYARVWSPDQTLYLLSSDRGGRHALVGLDLREYDSIGLRFTLLAVDGRPPGYDTPQVMVGVVAVDDQRPPPSVLAVPTWSTTAWQAANDATAAPAPQREIGIAIRPSDPRWTGRAATLTLRVEPAPRAEALALEHVRPLRRATLSHDAIKAVLPVHGDVFARETSTPDGTVELDLRLDGGLAVVRLPDDVSARARQALAKGFDVVEVRATVLAVNDPTNGPLPRIIVAFMDAPLFEGSDMSFDRVERSAIVATRPDQVREAIGWKVSQLWELGREKPSTPDPRIETVTLRLEPAPDATVVP